MPSGGANKGNGPRLQWLKAHMSHEGDDCLIWPWPRNAHGYGMLGYYGKVKEAHRIMCILIHGSPPTPRHQAAHDCGNGQEGCVNPKHIFWKTPKQNRLDSNAHGTGNQPAPRRLTLDQVREIRASTLPYAELAEAYGVHRDTIGKIFRGETWQRPRSKLTREQVRRIKELAAKPLSSATIARMVDAPYNAVRMMRLRQNFRGE